MVADVGAVPLHAHQIAGKIVARLFVPPRHQIAAIFPVPHHVVGVRDLLFWREVAPGQQRAAFAPGLDVRRLLRRHAEQAEDHQSRDLKGKIGNEIGFALVGKSIDCFVHDGADLRLQRLEASRAKRVLDDRPQPGVIGRHPR